MEIRKYIRDVLKMDIAEYVREYYMHRQIVDEDLDHGAITTQYVFEDEVKGLFAIDVYETYHIFDIPSAQFYRVYPTKVIAYRDKPESKSEHEIE